MDRTQRRSAFEHDHSVQPPQQQRSSSLTEQAENHDKVERLAYQFYVERGRMDGHSEEDWYKAEQFLRNLSTGHSTAIPNAA